MAVSAYSKALIVGACVLSCYAFLATSMATPRHRQVKRDSESLYDNIYSAIAEFSGTPEEEDPQPQKRSSRFNQGNNAQLNQRDQLPRGGKRPKTTRSFLDKLLASFQKPGPPLVRKTRLPPITTTYRHGMRAMFRPSPRMGQESRLGPSIVTTRIASPLARPVSNPNNPFLLRQPLTSSSLSKSHGNRQQLQQLQGALDPGPHLDLTSPRPKFFTTQTKKTTEPFLPVTFTPRPQLVRQSGWGGNLDTQVPERPAPNTSRNQDDNSQNYWPITTFHPPVAQNNPNADQSNANEPFLPFLSGFEGITQSKKPAPHELFATLPPLPSNAIVFRPNESAKLKRSKSPQSSNSITHKGKASSFRDLAALKVHTQHKFKPHIVSGRGSPSQPETFLNPNFHTTILKPLEESKDPSGRAVLTQTFLVRPRPTGLGSFSWNQMQLSSPPISKAKLVQLAQTPSVSSLGTFASGIGNKSPASALPAVASPFPPNLALSHPAQLSFSTLLDPQGQGISHPKSSASTPHFPPLLPFPGRQATTRQVIVDGFPSGLPNGTPKGVVIALASAQNLAPGEMPPIPGEAGVDYPVLTEVPETGFDCNAQTFPGIYADTGADCQVFYMCQPNGNFNGFLCPNGTVFNQQYFICDWWYNFDCGDAQSFYGLNEFIYQDQPSGKNCNSLFCSND